MFDTLIAGLLQGNVYALGAVGISLVFGVMNVVNFAQHGIREDDGPAPGAVAEPEPEPEPEPVGT